MILHDEVLTDACVDATDVFGEGQIGLCMEECAELIQALSKYQRLKKGQPVLNKTADEVRENVIEEMGDVLIMLQQLQLLLSIGDHEILWSMKKKAKRLNFLTRTMEEKE